MDTSRVRFVLRQPDLDLWDRVAQRLHDDDTEPVTWVRLDGTFWPVRLVTGPLVLCGVTTPIILDPKRRQVLISDTVPEADRGEVLFVADLESFTS